ncbi:Endocytosis and vacuole integrity protein [Rhizina undulata]
MTAQFLNAELTNLVQEAKRKNSDLRHAAEKSLLDLKSIGPTSDVAVELSAKPGFLSPFLIACGTRNAKFSTIAVVCLQRIIVSRALAKSRLKEVLEAFREAANLGVEIQLKILQALPSLLQNYAEELQGNLLGEALLICSMLQGSKMGVVNNTAAATLSQIVISIFDKVVTEDEKELEIPTAGKVPSDSGRFPVKPAALDAYRVFYDLCLLTEGQNPEFLRFSVLPQPFGLELIESVLTNHPEIFLSHPEQAHILRTRVAPLVIRSLSERLNFPTTVRITRVLYILLRRHLSVLPAECEYSLELLTHMLEPDTSQPWKRALCMEVFRGICAEPSLIRKIFSEYDAKEGKKPIIKELMGALTRLATEKPSVIGLGTQSTAPVGQQIPKDAALEQAAMEAGGVAGIIGGAVGLGDITVPGLSTQWSLMRVPCIDQLDKSEPPMMPESYIYCLTLTCINSFSEGLAKFILPLSVPADGSKGTKRRATRVISAGVVRTASDSDLASSAGTGAGIRPDSPTRTPSPAKSGVKRRATTRQFRVPVNPLTLESHPLQNDIMISAAIIEACWPAVLAACSTFLYAALDNEFYHGLVRAFQKFTHVAGLLRLTTPRDAFLTTLGKAAVPSNVLSANISAYPTTPAGDSGLFSNTKGLLSADNSNPGPQGQITNMGEHNHPPSLNSRNLLCLRALLNLGIALGPTLEYAWSIILETLQQADYVVFASSRKHGRQMSLSGSRPDVQKQNEASNLMTNIGPELTAVEAAASKMFEGTRDFPDEAFVAMLQALCKLLDVDNESKARSSLDKPISPNRSPARSPRSPTFSHKRIHSVSSTISSQVIGDNAFALAKIGELAQINMSRIVGPNPAATGWDLLVSSLVSIFNSRETGKTVRIRAAEVLNEVVVVASKTVIAETTENLAEVQKRILGALREEVANPDRPDTSDSATRSTELEIHRAGLEALNAILEHSGQSLIAGWEIVFDIITSVFDPTMVWRRDSVAVGAGGNVKADTASDEGKHGKSPKLIRGSFASLELICSDFLASLPTACVLVLVDALFAFCCQKDDLNISLTTITFFWNVSAFLQSRGDSASQGELLTSKAENERDLLNVVENTDVDSNSALWMLLLLRLTGVSSDRRAEVRNGSIQTLFRIFDTYGHRLGPQAWSSCLKIVVFKMMTINPTDSSIPQSSASDRKQWDNTINLVLSGIGTLYSNYFDIFAQQAEFRMTWSVFIRYLESLISRHSFEVNATVFRVLSQVLSKVRPSTFNPGSREEVWKMWSSQGVSLVEDNPETSRTGIQETLTSYVETFKPLYNLVNPTLSPQIVAKTLEILRECILFPDAPSYFQDVEILTPLQAVILEAVQMIRTDLDEVPALLLISVSEFSTVAYEKVYTVRKGRIPTYIALATQSMKILENITLKHVNEPEIYTSSALKIVLKALAVPVGLKYDFNPGITGKKPSQWILATKVVLSILAKALPAMDQLGIEPVHQTAVWEQVVALVGSIVSAANNTGVEENLLLADEDFDIDSFRKIRELIVPSLGRKVVPRNVLYSYAESIFRSSLLYHVDGLQLPGEDSEVASLLKGRKLGVTSELMLERRKRMAYVCIDELFSLVGITEGSPQYERLAIAAAPFLILRAGLVLQLYISDQPLRGRMPQPVCQRKEILYILQKLVTLNSSSKTFSIDSSHIPPSTKLHLFKLFPLFSQCIAVAQGDQELLQLLSSALNEMGLAVGVS